MADHEEEMMEIGAHVKGEGEILGTRAAVASLVDRIGWAPRYGRVKWLGRWVHWRGFTGRWNGHG